MGLYMPKAFYRCIKRTKKWNKWCGMFFTFRGSIFPRKNLVSAHIHQHWKLALALIHLLAFNSLFNVNSFNYLLNFGILRRLFSSGFLPSYILLNDLQSKYSIAYHLIVFYWKMNCCNIESALHSNASSTKRTNKDSSNEKWRIWSYLGKKPEWNVLFTSQLN